MLVRMATYSGPNKLVGPEWTSGSHAPLNRFSPPLMALRRLRPAHLLVSKLYGEPRISSLQRVTTSRGPPPFRRKSPPSLMETRCFMATGHGRINPVESVPRALADSHPGERNVTTRRICADLRLADNLLHLLSSRGLHCPRLRYKGEGCIPRTASLREIDDGPEEPSSPECVSLSRHPPHLSSEPVNEPRG